MKPETCVNGHKRTAENTYRYYSGGVIKTSCKDCNRESHRRRYQKNREAERARLRDRYRRIGK